MDVCCDSRRLSGSGRAPIRILADTTNVLVSSNFTASQRNFLINTVLPIAIGNLSSMLLVDPVSGKLAASRSCSGGYLRSGPNVGKCVSYSTSLPVCNSLPLVTIPLSYLGNSYTGCTDYSNVRSCVCCGRVWCAAKVSIFSYPSPDSWELYVRYRWRWRLQCRFCGVCHCCTNDSVSVLALSCVALVWHGSTVYSCPAKGEAGTLAYAADCQRDQMDRPTFGSINFCPHSVPSGVDASYQLAIHTTIHELMHAVGFSARSWPLFRGASGTPLTPRDSVFPHTPASSYSMYAH
jgi:Leishmanolysin